MPLSHLGLTVSHIPSATSFYLAALQPLGYHYVGQQGESIGLGITDADFFLCQEQNGARVSPTHLAFAADSRVIVRDCYAAALNAGGRPSGAPNYRNRDCGCFNAAVEDLDGNTIEFIFRESSEAQGSVAPSEHNYSQPRQKSVAPQSVYDDVPSLASTASPARSRAQTALDIASTAAKSTKPKTPSTGISRSRTEPVTSTSDGGSKAVVGTLLGAAAGAAFAYAMVRSERDSAREEDPVANSARSKAPSLKNSRTQSNYEGSTFSRKSYRTTDSARNPKHPSRSMRAIEAPSYDDGDVQQIISRYNSSQRPALSRSRTYDGSEYISASATNRRDDFSFKPASTSPADVQHYLLEGPRTAPASRHTSRRGSLEGSTLKRHDSGVSMNSHRSRRSFDGGRRPSSSKASTVKPAAKGSLYASAAGVPLPSSKAQSYISAADMPLPTSKAASYISAAQIPIPSSRAYGGYTDVGEESDGLGDMNTVVPEDSISCVDFSTTKSMQSKSRSKSSRHSSKRSEANSERTVRPAKPAGSKHSAQTMPVRSKDDHSQSRSRLGKKSLFSYA